MKYITEADLRNLYRTTPFTTYETEPGTRLTPGARQFLGDRGIRVPDEIPSAKRFGDSGTGGKKPLYFWRQEENKAGMIRTVLVQMQKKTQQRRTAWKVRSDVRRI